MNKGKYCQFRFAEGLAHIRQFNSFLASGECCHLLITFASSLDPDKDRQNVSPDHDPNCFTLLTMLMKDFFEKVDLKKVSRQQQKQEKLPL